MTKYMAIQLPALCPLSCEGCRTIEFNRQGFIPGNLDAMKEHLKTLASGDYLFITSTGEPGYTEDYEEIISNLIHRGVEVSLCCSNKKSILPGMVRAEISRSEEQDKTSLKAIEKARSLGIPYVATVVNFGQYDNVDMEDLRKELADPDAIIIRQAQPEGAAKDILKNKAAKTKIWKKPDIYFGKLFPAPCFQEFEEYRSSSEIVCIDHNGKVVQWLGGESEELSLKELVASR